MSFNLVLNNAVRLHEQGRLDEAEAMYRQLLEIAPEQTDVLHLLGMLALQKKSFDSAVELLYKAVRLAPDVVAYEFTLAQALQDSGHPKEALEHYKSVLKKDDSLPEAYHNMGIIYRFDGDFAEAERLFQKAVELRPDFASAYVNLALLARDKGQMDRALSLLDRALQVDSDNAEAYAQIAVTHRLCDRFEQALEYYEKALSLQAGNPIYWNGMGIAFECLEQLDDAFHAYCRAVELDPGFADAYNNRANVLAKLGRHWQAEEDYKKAVKLDPAYASAFNNLGALLYDQERYEEALECYRKAFIINPKQAETCSNLAMAVKEAGDPAEAVGLYFTALHLNPVLTKIHHYLAQTLYDLYQSKQDADRETAVKLAQKWVQFFPDSPIAAHVYAALNGDMPDQAANDYIRELFDSFAESFEATLKKISYQIPNLLAVEMEKQPQNLRILDAGCGTGTNAAVLKRHAAVLTGTDLSEKMITAATAKELYDRLEVSDIIRFCENNPDSFDLVVLADVACYFGKLDSLMRAVNKALSVGGTVFMTVENLDSEQEYVLRPSGRFAHSKAYVEAVLERNGFEKKTLNQAVLREENGSGILGTVLTAEKNAEISNSNLDNDDKKD
ncbi:MAG: tetratricopeptide repeat protein [Alphaproteobacteria bacterium]|nr:tetratricopeptide repeat protein [Alphaproteobacteria bacterium]